MKRREREAAMKFLRRKFLHLAAGATALRNASARRRNIARLGQLGLAAIKVA